MHSQALARAGPWAEALEPGPWPLGGSWALGPPKGQGSGSGPDPDDLVVTDDHDIPYVSDYPKSILTSLKLSNLRPESLRWVLWCDFSDFSVVQFLSRGSNRNKIETLI